MFLEDAANFDGTLNMPWYLDSTYETIMYPKVGFSFTSNSAPRETVDHPQTKSMLYALKHYNQATFHSLQFEHHKAAYQITGLDNKIENKTYPDYLDPNWDPYYNYCTSDPGFFVIESIRNNQKLFDYMDEMRENEAEFSEALQLDESHKVRVYKSKNGCYYTVLTNRWNPTLARKLIALMPKMFPFITIPESVADIFRMFGENDYDKWCDTYSAWIKPLNLLEKIRHDALVKALAYKREKQIQNLRSSIRQYDSNIQNYLANVQQMASKKQECMVTLYGYEHQVDETAETLYDYLVRNKSVASFSLRGTILYLTLRTPWSYYDQKLFDRIAANQSSDIYAYGDVHMLLKKVFSQKPEFEIWTDACVYIDLENLQYGVNNTSGCQMFPQTHLHGFTCWGNNQGYIYNSVSAMDFIGAIEQMIAASKNLNWADSPVIKRMSEWMTGNTGKRPTIKYLKTGEFINFQQAISIIKEEMRKDAENKDNGPAETVNNAENPATVG